MKSIKGRQQTCIDFLSQEQCLYVYYFLKKCLFGFVWSSLELWKISPPAVPCGKELHCLLRIAWRNPSPLFSICCLVNLQDVLSFLYQWGSEHNFLLKSPHLSWFWGTCSFAFSAMSSPDWRVLVCSVTLCTEGFGHPAPLFLYLSQFPSISEESNTKGNTLAASMMSLACLSQFHS